MDERFEALRAEPDPVVRGRRATELLVVYQQRSAELARLRRAAIEEAREQLGGSYTEVARAFGLTKGRITQIRSSAPPDHRAALGVGPLEIALPGRHLPGSTDLVIATKDDTAGALLTHEAGHLGFSVEHRMIRPDDGWEPKGDAVVVCGPLSGHVGRVLLAADPVIDMAREPGGRWHLTAAGSGDVHPSPLDSDPAARADHAYLARHARAGQVVVHVAGLHALGSIGGARYLTDHLADLWAEFGDRSFSMAVTAEFDGLTPTRVEVLIPPRAWPA